MKPPGYLPGISARATASLLLALLVGVGISACSEEDLTALWQECRGGKGGIRQESCTRLIESGRLTPKETHEALLWRARAHLGAGAHSKMMADVDRVLKSVPNHAAALVLRGVHHQINGRTEQALKDFSAAIKADRSLPDGWEHRAELYLRLEQYEKAVSDFTQAIRLSGRHFGPILGRAWAYLKLRRFDEAKKDVALALRLFPELAAAYRVRGRIHLAQNNLDEAEADAETALRKSPKVAAGWVLRALIYEARGARQRAIADFRKAASLAPKHPEALAGLKRLGASR